HRQRSGRSLRRIAGLAAFLLALVVTERARAGVAEENKAVVGFVAVLPLDVHAVAGGKVDFDGRGIGGGDGFSIARGQSAFGTWQNCRAAPVPTCEVGNPGCSGGLPRAAWRIRANSGKIKVCPSSSKLIWSGHGTSL